jgi:hypothetical protein
MKVKKQPIAIVTLIIAVTLMLALMLAAPVYANSLEIDQSSNPSTSGASGELPPSPEAPGTTFWGIVWAAVILITLAVLVLRKLE